jgi:Integron-associated effector binding protein
MIRLDMVDCQPYARSVERRDGPTIVVERPLVRVMYLTEVPDEPGEIKQAWEELEDRVGSLRGRKFFGVFDGGTYRACVQLKEEDDPVREGFRTSVLPGGKYIRARLRGDDPDRLYQRIPDTFSAMESETTRDLTRPGIEHYRRLDEVDLLLPTAEA